jgi:hypothetical protein
MGIVIMVRSLRISETQGTGGNETGSKRGPQKSSCKGRRILFITKDIPASVSETKTPPLATFRLILLNISHISAYVSVLNSHLTEKNPDAAWPAARRDGNRCAP